MKVISARAAGYPHADPEEFSLPEARVEMLVGFVWINMDPDAATLRDYIGPKALRHMEAWEFRDRYIVCHVMKPIPCNWKPNVEALLESYHVLATHPQVSPASADANAQYDIYGENVSRYMSALGVVSPHFQRQLTERDELEQFTVGYPSLGADRPILPDGATARQAMAGLYRTRNNADRSRISDTELLDVFPNMIYPNMFIFPGISVPLVFLSGPTHTTSGKPIIQSYIGAPPNRRARAA